jgi:hypothetical protein
METLLLKLPPPKHMAVSVFAPGVSKAMEQLPSVTVPVQLCVPSDTVTFPTGIPYSGVNAETV